MDHKQLPTNTIITEETWKNKGGSILTLTTLWWEEFIGWPRKHCLEYSNYHTTQNFQTWEVKLTGMTALIVFLVEKYFIQSWEERHKGYHVTNAG